MARQDAQADNAAVAWLVASSRFEMARLKGLDEFETPEFVGRMDRIAKRRRIAWWTMLTGATVIGASLGLTLF